MTDQRNFTRTVMAISSVVVACCAVAVTVKVLSTDTISVEQPRVLDQEALERQVTDEIQGEVKSLACPTSVPVEVGHKFECRYWGETNPGNVEVKIVSGQGKLLVTAQ